ILSVPVVAGDGPGERAEVIGARPTRGLRLFILQRLRAGGFVSDGAKLSERKTGAQASTRLIAKVLHKLLPLSSEPIDQRLLTSSPTGGEWDLFQRLSQSPHKLPTIP